MDSSQKIKILILSTLMSMEGWVKFFSPQNTAGVSQEKRHSKRTEVNGDNFQQTKTYVKITIKCLPADRLFFF